MMTNIEISRATERDIPAVLDLMSLNQRETGGSLSVMFTYQDLAISSQSMPMIVARQNKNVIGFLLSSSKEFNSDNPIICKMLSNYQGSEDSYIYGPICVRNTERGMGLAQAMFAELKRCLPEREGILFIRSDNDASLRAHEKIGMNKVSEFTIGSTSYITFSYTA